MSSTLQSNSSHKITKFVLGGILGLVLAVLGLYGMVANSSASAIPAVGATPLVGCDVPDFGFRVNYHAGREPSYVISADFNGDNKADMAVTNAEDSNVSIFLGNGLGGFDTAVNYTTGEGPGVVITADFNNDGKLDLATANPSGFLDNVSVLLGNGDGTFRTVTNYGAGTTAYGIDTADFNHDGNLDLAVANSNSANISILFGKGAGLFTTPTNITVGQRPVFIRAGDFNDDNNPDVAVADGNLNSVRILLGNGTGGFGTPIAFDAGANVRDITVADLNDDGELDIVAANAFSNTVSILQGNGSGSFAAPESLDVGNNANAISVGDLNNDGNPDLAVSVDSPGAIVVMLGDGTGNYGAPTSFSTASGSHSVAIADYNRDGALDMATADFGTVYVSVLLNNCVPATETPVPTFTATSTSTATSTNTPTSTATATAEATSTAVATNTAEATTTSTASVPSATSTTIATATATVCSVQFSDVPAGSTFYSYVDCLVCRGIVSGYPDGTFRPNNVVTRGQAAKIISNSGGYDDVIPATQQTFTDVPPDSSFWVYVERVALHGAINGYPDGTFRPANNVTRGQLAKIDSEVKGYNDEIPSTQQTFSDVEPGSTFWLYIERVALHGVVKGYSDGTFRPVNDVTRGQAAKIASLTFFPECNP